jgi:L-iditol 2-dehydrogenase
MRVAATDGAGGLVVAERPLPTVPADGALVRMRACGLCGSDLEKLDRGLGAGVVLGHEVVGLLERPGEVPIRVALAHHVPCGDCPACVRGHSSLCDQFVNTELDPGGFAEWLAVSARHLADVVFPLPDEIDDVTGTLLEPLSCVLRAVDVAGSAYSMFPSPLVRGVGSPGRGPGASEIGPAPPAEAGPGVASNVLVAGCGSVGLLFLTVLAATDPGSASTFLERDPRRAALAHGLGAAPAGGEPVERAFVTAAAALPQVIQMMAPGGVVVVFAAEGGVGLDVDLDTVYRRELTVVGVRSGSPGHLRRALDLLAGCVRADGREGNGGDFGIDLSWYDPEVVGLDGLAEAIHRYRCGETMKVVVRP